LPAPRSVATNRAANSQQIADGVRSLIAGSGLTEGQPLPRVRRLAAGLGVNLNTIAAAYRERQSDGPIAAKRSSRAAVAWRSDSQHTGDELRGLLRHALTGAASRFGGWLPAPNPGPRTPGCRPRSGTRAEYPS
jgi:DNA-binding transcriptional regulator YhcF (GntR family)